MTDEQNYQSPPAELALLRDAMRSREAPARVERELVRQFRARQEDERFRGSWWRIWSVAAVAVTIVLAVLVLRPDPLAPEPRVVTAGELSTDYLPLGYGSPLYPDDYAQVVRISVPRSEMSRFGLPVRFDSGPERVLADVVVGEDGIARAIRFVE